MTDTLMRRVPEAEMSDALKAARAGALALTGDATITEVFANSEKVCEFFFNGFYKGLFFNGDVPIRYKELLRLRLSKVHGCWFCNRNNEAGARAAGFTDVQIQAIGGDADADFEDARFTGAERAVLALADELVLTNMGGTLTPALYEALKSHFSDGEIVELSMVGAILGGLNKMAFVLNLVERETWCPFTPAEAARHAPAESATVPKSRHPCS
jgi:AhpD family alkylhydroperoxidase